VAVTDFAASTITVQDPVPEQAPLQPAKAEPVAGVAVRATGVPSVKDEEHVFPQSIPAGLLLTLPLPAPLFPTLRVNC